MEMIDHEYDEEKANELAKKIQKLILPYGIENSINTLMHVLMMMIDICINNKVETYSRMASICINEIKDLNQKEKNENERPDDQIKDFKRSRKTKKQIPKDLS